MIAGGTISVRSMLDLYLAEAGPTWGARRDGRWERVNGVGPSALPSSGCLSFPDRHIITSMHQKGGNNGA
jgi:hypothetical protein